jgi:hypothetical protein
VHQDTILTSYSNILLKHDKTIISTNLTIFSIS